MFAYSCAPYLSHDESFHAATLLSEKPAYFSYEEKGWYFDLRFEGTADLDDGFRSSGNYLLSLNFCRV